MMAAVTMSKVSALAPHGAIRSSLQMIGHKTEPINANTSERHRTFSEKPIIGFKGFCSFATGDLRSERLARETRIIAE
jgi:hypothetical protein